MSVTEHTLTYDFADVTGDALDPRHTVAWIETNIPGDVIVDTGTSGKVLAGAKVIVSREIASTSGTVALPTTAGATNPTGFQYRVWLEYRTFFGGKPAQKRWNSGYFSFTADANLKDVVAEQYVPPTYVSQAIDQLDAHQAELLTALTQAGLGNFDEAVSIIDADPATQFRQQQDARAASIAAGLQTQIDGFTALGTYQGAWAAASYATKDVVLYSSTLYIATTPATSSDVPGVASLWKALPTTVDTVARTQSATVPAMLDGLLQRTNRATNPGPNKTGGWITLNSTLYGNTVRDTTTVRRVGTTSVRLTRTSSSPSSIIASFDRLGQDVSLPAANVPVDAALTYRFNVYGRCDVAALGSIKVSWYNAGGTQVGSTQTGATTTMTANTWTSFGYTVQPPATTTSVQIQAVITTADGSNAATGTNAWVQDLWIVPTTEPDGGYFDGSMSQVGTGVDAEIYSWSGAVGASTSKGTANPVYRAKVAADIAAALDGTKSIDAVQVNRALNPGPTKAGGWISADSSLYGVAVRDTTTVARAGTTSVRLTRTSATPGIFIASFDRIGQDVTSPAANIPVTVGDSIYATVKLRCDTAAQGQLKISFVDAVGASVSSRTHQLVPMAANTWTTVTAPFVVPTGAVMVQMGALIRTTDGSNAVAGTNAWCQDLMIGNGPYIDGNMAASGDTVYSWAGTVGGSESRAHRPIRKHERDTYDPLYLTLASEASLQQRTRLSKGGWIGTSGKGAVALRFDHWLDALYATLWPLCVARGLPAGVCLYSAMLDTTSPWFDSDSDSVTYANIAAETIKNGLEVWGHSHSHTDTPASFGKDWLTKEIVTSKTDLEAAMPTVKIQGWMMPGISHAVGVKPYTCLDTPLRTGLDTTVASDWWNSDGGRLIRQTYGLVEGDTHGTVRQLPTGPLVGAAHETADTMTLTALKAVVDRAANYKTGVEIMTHAGVIDTPGNMTLADWTAFLDYVVAARDAGLIDVVTPSGLHFANPDTSRRAAILAQGDFTGFNTGAPGLWAGLTGVTTGTDSGVGHVEIAAAGSMYQDYTALKLSLFDGEPFMVDCEVRRAVSGTAATAKVTLSEPAGTWSQTYTNAIPFGTGWTRWRIPFCTPLGAATARTLIGHSAGGAVQFRNVKVVKV